MDALKFARERTRMCSSNYGKCQNCPAYKTTHCSSIENTEELLPIVEKWSAEHPTNLDHVAEGLEKLGYKVDKNYLKDICPVPYSSFFFFEPRNCPENKNCAECTEWWHEEYKGAE